MAKKSTVYWITGQAQLAALASPVRQEIVDVVAVIGPCSIERIAQVLGLRADRLYFHVRRLQSVGLVIRRGTSGQGRKAAAIYDAPGKSMRIRYEPRSSGKVRAVGMVTESVLRLSRRDLKRAMQSPASILNGPLRDTWAGRVRGWMTPNEVRRMNRLVEEILSLIRSGSVGAGARQVAFTFVLAPPKGGLNAMTDRKEY